jgi:hypothetical protein
MPVSEALLFQQRVRARSGMGMDLECNYNSLKRKEAQEETNARACCQVQLVTAAIILATSNRRPH